MVYSKDTILRPKMQLQSCTNSGGVCCYISAISCSISSMRVAQLVAMRTTV